MDIEGKKNDQRETHEKVEEQITAPHWLNSREYISIKPLVYLTAMAPLNRHDPSNQKGN